LLCRIKINFHQFPCELSANLQSPSHILILIYDFLLKFCHKSMSFHFSL
jgi:hypothetical protein